MISYYILVLIISSNKLFQNILSNSKLYSSKNGSNEEINAKTAQIEEIHTKDISSKFEHIEPPVFPKSCDGTENDLNNSESRESYQKPKVSFRYK